MVKSISRQYKIPSNFMFMSSFGEKMEYSFMDLGGLRLITPNMQTIEEKEDHVLCVDTGRSSETAKAHRG
eukprot:TRINITY_DN2243_c0_g1_i1.p6 TRINITY_DN2243_c0_g1~~TRINITY_DN2243_c0_g1_i1.p6  ORF type:complete len:70 (+),score=17.66 TRINITY_DN2243_c0_g1_i1:653-862(+)